MDDGKLDALGQTIVSALGGAASAHAVAFNQLTITVDATKIVEVMKYLRDDPALRFVNFTDVTAVDYPGREKRFGAEDHLLSPPPDGRIRVPDDADDNTHVAFTIELVPRAAFVH